MQTVKDIEHPIGKIIKGHEKKVNKRKWKLPINRKIFNLIRNQNIQIKSEISFYHSKDFLKINAHSQCEPGCGKISTLV